MIISTKKKYFFLPFFKSPMKEVREEDIAPSAPHEKKAFLVEYEGPTQLYRLLNHRHEVDPTFLCRNINYERIKKKTKALG